MTENAQTADLPPQSNRTGRLVAALAGVLALVLVLNHLSRQRQVESTSPGPSGLLAEDAEHGITLARQVGEDRQEVVVAADQEITVLQAMRRAAEASPAWQFAHQGAGGSAFLTQLGGTTNEGADGRNWQYEVNGKSADVSFGVHPTKPGDRVLWKFAAYE